jgi:DNA-binding transcriptional MocR family regulator
MVILTVDKGAAAPAYRQICERVMQLVDSGALSPGERLPPSRVLARTAGVHRTTVMRAYGDLWALGYLESRPGSYSTVRRPVRAAAESQESQTGGDGLIPWHAVTRPSVRRAAEDAALLARDQAPAPGVVDFGRLSADPLLAPVDEIRRCFKQVLLEDGRRLVDYGDAAGYRPLRDTVARRMRVHGVTVSAEEILITSGAQHGLDLVLRLLTRPGDRVVTESPSYGSALSLFRLHELRLRDVAMRPDGMDLDALEAVLGRTRPALVYTIPNFQNPTGLTTSQAHRERLLALCEARRVPIVEDGFEEEMKYFGRAVLPIKAMDTRGVVIYVGTLSKVVFPGLRVGWIAAPRGCVDRLGAIQRASCLSGNLLAQAAVERFCSSGGYEAHLRRTHAVYRKRMQAMLRGLRTFLPPGVEWTEPAGGYTLWLRVHAASCPEEAIYERLLRAGVKVASGSAFFAAAPTGPPQFRLSIACVPEEEIVEGCRRLGRALAAIVEPRRSAAGPSPARV